MRATLSILFALYLVACASDPWSSYHGSLHDALSDGTREARSEHAEHLAAIVAAAEKAGRKPPPGIYAELAYYKARLGEPSEMSRLLAKEREAYPESEEFLGMLENLLLDPDFETWPGGVE
jgi:hypothetical protein